MKKSIKDWIKNVFGLAVVGILIIMFFYTVIKPDIELNDRCKDLGYNLAEFAFKDDGIAYYNCCKYEIRSNGTYSKDKVCIAGFTE